MFTDCASGLTFRLGYSIKCDVADEVVIGFQAGDIAEIEIEIEMEIEIADSSF